MSFVEHASPYHQYQQSPSQMAAASSIGSPPDQMNPQTSHVGPNVNPIQGTTKLSNSLNEWFEQMIEMRRLKALLCHAAFSSALYLLFACVLQISLVHPIGTIYDILSLLSSSRTILFLVGYVLMNTMSTYIIGRFLLRFDSEKKLSKKDWHVWCVLAGFIVLDNLKGHLLLTGSGVTFVKGIIVDAPSFIVHVPVLVATFMNVFECDYRLQIPAFEFGAVHQLQSALRLGNEAALKSLLVVGKWTVVFTFLIGLPMYGWTIFPAVFSVRIVFSTLVLAYSQAILHYLSLKCLKALVLQHYTFALPPAHAVVDPTPEQLRTLPNAMESTSVNLKTFAFWDLRKLSANNYQRRMVLFSLSQPGGHPRNWNSVRTICMDVLDKIRVRIDEENARIRKETFASLNRLSSNGYLMGGMPGSNGGGPTMLLPNQLRKDHDLRRRIVKDQPMSKAQSVIASKSGVLTFVQKLRSSLFDNQQQIVTALEETLAILSTESLCMLVWHSYEEDRFGVVQKDLGTVISLMLKLVVSLDKYIHNLKPSRESDQPKEQSASNNSVYYTLETTVCSALSRIVAKFKGTLKSIQLSDDELALLNTLTQITA